MKHSREDSGLYSLMTEYLYDEDERNNNNIYFLQFQVKSLMLAMFAGKPSPLPRL